MGCLGTSRPAGNLTTDTYTGAGNRAYDAENKMMSAQGIECAGVRTVLNQ